MARPAGTVALLGASGFVGRHVARAAEAKGWRVRGLARRPTEGGVRIDVASATPQGLAQALAGCDAVVNTVGVKRREGGQGFEEAHVRLMEMLVAACRLAGVRRVVHVSVLNARPDGPHEYHRSKARGDALLRQSGLDWTVLRPSVIWGEGDDLVSHLAKMLRASPVFPIVGRGRTLMQPVHVEDVAAAAVAALGEPRSVGRSLDVVGPETLELRDIVRRVAGTMGLRAAILPTPPQLMAVPAAVMTRFAQRPITTSGQLAILREGLAGDGAEAAALLGLRPRPFEAAGIRAAVPPAGRALLWLRFGERVPEPAPPWATLAAVALVSVAAVLVGFGGGFLDTWTRLVLCFAVAGTFAAVVGQRLLRDSWRPTAWMALLGTAVGVALYAASWLVAQVPAVADSLAEVFELQGGHPIWFVAPTLLVAIVAEEVMWRAVLVGGLSRRMPAWAAVVLGALLYGLPHLASGSPLLLAAALGLGLLWGAMYVATRSLVAVILCHAVCELLAAVLFPVG